jgi:hypothetical protein
MTAWIIEFVSISFLATVLVRVLAVFLPRRLR